MVRFDITHGCTRAAHTEPHLRGLTSHRDGTHGVRHLYETIGKVQTVFVAGASIALHLYRLCADHSTGALCTSVRACEPAYGRLAIQRGNGKYHADPSARPPPDGSALRAWRSRSRSRRASRSARSRPPLGSRPRTRRASPRVIRPPSGLRTLSASGSVQTLARVSTATWPSVK